MQSMTSFPKTSSRVHSSGGRLVATDDGRPIPLRGCSLKADAGGGLAHVVVRQTFFNESDEPLQATYQFPLPADAAVGGYSFTVGNRRIVGEIDRRDCARERFEEAILEGRTAGLVEQDRSSLFTQEIGNIPPHTVVICELQIDQRLRWLEDGQWEWRFPTTIAPSYMGQPGRVPDADRVMVDVTAGVPVARLTLDLRVRDAELTGPPNSPTHRVNIASDGLLTFESQEGVPLDRDVVVRWSAAREQAALAIDVARPFAEGPLAELAFGLLTLVPPRAEEERQVLPRDLILLLDTSGSMHGLPLEHAKAVARTLVESLGPGDQLELIEFSGRPQRWQERPVLCDGATKAGAVGWIESLQAGGGTEMVDGLMGALASLRPDAQRQVVLITDGLVGFDEEAVAAVRSRTPRGCRVHSVGVGSASNRSLTHRVAAAGGGTEFLVDLDEDAALTAARIVARLSRPLIVDVQVRGTALLEAAGPEVRDLMAGAPVLIPVTLRPEGGTLTVEGRTGGGMWKAETTVLPVSIGTGSTSLAREFARAFVERLELEAAVGGEVDSQIEALGLRCQIATRLTSWIAISEEPTVDPREPMRRVRIAQQLPYGMSVEGLGLGEADYRSHRPLGGLHRSMVLMRLACAYPEGVSDAPMRAYDFAQLMPDTASRMAHSFLIARVVSHHDGRLVLEIELDHEAKWDPAAIEISTAPGTRIDRRATTKRGRYGPGQRLRLVLVGLPENTNVASLQRVWIRTRQGERLEVRILP